MPNRFEEYRFSRLFISRNLEFFFILGVDNSDDYGEFWDSTLRTQLGYVAVHRDDTLREEKIVIYLIFDHVTEEELTREVVKQSKRFISMMPYSPDTVEYETSYTIKRSSVRQKSIVRPYRDFIVKVLKDDVDAAILEQITF